MLTWPTVLQILWTSLATASYYVLFATAFALVLKVNGVFNFAQAGLMTVAFYAAHATIDWTGLHGAVAFAVALAATLATAFGLERFGFATMRRNQASPMFMFIFTIVASEFVAYLAMLVFGTWPKTIFPSLFWPVTLVGDIAVSAWDVPAIATAVAGVGGLWAFMRFTRRGQFMLAVADNPGLAEFYGINRDRVFLLTVAAIASAVPYFLALAVWLSVRCVTVVRATGNVVNIHVVRKPAADEVAPWVIAMVKRAAPFPAPAKMAGGTVKYTETYFVDKSGLFQAFSLTEGQR